MAKKKVAGVSAERLERRQLAESDCEELRLCPKCKVKREIRYFGFRDKDKTKLKSWCNKCAAEASNALYNYEEKRKYSLKFLYGISVEEYDRLRVKQDFKCALCGRHENDVYHGLHVDHCHKTGEVRGLLCHLCNTMLGKIENRDLLDKVIDYLQEK